jgi:hypothetical protein
VGEKGAMEVRETAQIPPLQWEGEGGSQKARLFSKKLFPSQLEADLDDVTEMVSQTINMRQDVTRGFVLMPIPRQKRQWPRDRRTIRPRTLKGSQRWKK